MQGRSYLCKRLDMERRLAVVCPANLKYYTRTVDHTDVCVVGSHRAAFQTLVCLIGFTVGFKEICWGFRVFRMGNH